MLIYSFSNFPIYYFLNLLKHYFLPKLNSIKFVPRRNFICISVYFFHLTFTCLREWMLLALLCSALLCSVLFCSALLSCYFALISCYFKEICCLLGLVAVFFTVRYQYCSEACCLYMCDSKEHASILFQMMSLYPAARRHIPKSKGRLYLGDLVNSFSQFLSQSSKC